MPDLNAPTLQQEYPMDSQAPPSSFDAARLLVEESDRGFARPSMEMYPYDNGDSSAGSEDDFDPVENNNEDDEQTGEPSTSTPHVHVPSSAPRMHEPPSAFFTDIGGLRQHIDPTPSDVVQMSQFDPNVDELKKGLLFLTKKQLKDAVARYSIVQSREYKTGKNNNKKIWEVVCKHSDTTNCGWKLRASIQKKHDMFEIVTYQGPHTCVFDKSNEDHPQLDTNIIANEILSLVRADPSLKIKVIVEAVKKSYKKYRVTYYKAWYGKQKAISIIFGDWDESYRRLPKFLGAIQKYNPGTIVKWSTNDFINPDNTINPDKVIFRRVFWAFKASIDGFKHCRPFISIDATFLYGKYKGKILIAMAKDGNNQLFPIAFAIVDEESKNNWGWFLYSLRHNVIGDRPDICLISDRHKGIIAAVNDRRYGWTDHHHRYCLRHVRSNFNSKFQNSVLKDLVWEAGSTTQTRIFDQAMEKIKGINQNAWEYLNNIPAKQWTLCHDGGYRFGETTSNMVESYNGVLKEGRNLPITACVQVIFFKVVKYFEERRRFALQMSANGMTITSSAFLMWELNDNLSSTHNVEIFDRAKGEANVYSRRGNYYAVVLSEHTCTCGRWEAYRIPCSHAIKVCKTLARNSKNLISNWYSLSTYAQIWAPELHPLHHEEYWDEPNCPIWIPDHDLRRDKGRPRSTRIHNEMDIPKGRATACCGICGQAGHDRRRCPAREGQSRGTR